MQQFVICRVANPAFDRDGVVCTFVSTGTCCADTVKLAFVKNVAHRTVVQDHYFAEVRLYLRKILDVCAVAKSAMLAVVSASKVLAFDLQPVNDRVGVLLNGCCEYDQVVPFRNLDSVVNACCKDSWSSYVPSSGTHHRMVVCERSIE